MVYLLYPLPPIPPLPHLISQRPPSPPIHARDFIRRSRPLAAGRIIRKFRRLRIVLPSFQNRIHQFPRGLNAIRTIKQCRLSAYAVVDQRCVSLARGSAKRRMIIEIHRHRLNVHRRARRFRTERKRNSFIRLNVQRQRIRYHIFTAKHHMRRLLEPDRDLRRLPREPFAASQINRHPAPPPVIDKQPQREIRLRHRLRIHAWFLAIAWHIFSIDLPRPILSAHDIRQCRLARERPNALQNLDLLVAHCRRVKFRRRLHRNQRRQLQHVALDHVPQCARVLVKCRSPLDAQRLSGRNLHVIDIIPIPQRLKNAVAETKNQHILHRLFAEIVIDAVDLLLLEYAQHLRIQLACRSQIAPKRLFHNDPHPRFVALRPCQTRISQMLDYVWIDFRRRPDKTAGCLPDFPIDPTLRADHSAFQTNQDRRSRPENNEYSSENLSHDRRCRRKFSSSHRPLCRENRRRSAANAQTRAAGIAAQDIHAAPDRTAQAVISSAPDRPKRQTSQSRKDPKAPRKNRHPSDSSAPQPHLGHSSLPP